MYFKNPLVCSLLFSRFNLFDEPKHLSFRSHPCVYNGHTQWNAKTIIILDFSKLLKEINNCIPTCIDMNTT